MTSYKKGAKTVMRINTTIMTTQQMTLVTVRGTAADNGLLLLYP